TTSCGATTDRFRPDKLSPTETSKMDTIAIDMTTTYCQPTTLWRLQDLDGHVAHAVIVPRGKDVSVAWFLGGRLEEVLDFADCCGALTWAESIRWRLAEEGWLEQLSG